MLSLHTHTQRLELFFGKASAFLCVGCVWLPPTMAASLGAMKDQPIRFDGPDPLPPEPKGAPVAPVVASEPVPNPKTETATTRRLLGQAVLEEPLYLRCCPELSWEDRVLGFILCWAFGFALSLLSLLSFPRLMLGNPMPFAWTYSVGNVVAIVSSALLVGPKVQCEMMMAPVRLLATVAYLASIILTILSSLVLKSELLTLLFMIVQFGALLWYCASYIPFGRQIITTIIEKLCCRVNDSSPWPKLPSMV